MRGRAGPPTARRADSAVACAIVPGASARSSPGSSVTCWGSQESSSSPSTSSPHAASNSSSASGSNRIRMKSGPPVCSSCCRATLSPNRGRQLGRERAGPLPQGSTWWLSPAANAASNLLAANRTSSHGLHRTERPPGRSRSTKGQVIPAGCPDQERPRPATAVPTARAWPQWGVLRQRASASGSGRGSSSRSRVNVRPSARGMGSLPVPYLCVCAAMYPVAVGWVWRTTSWAYGSTTR